MKQSFVKCENGMVYYWHTDIDSTKKTLFLLHGLTANHTMFGKQVDYFKEKYNVIVWDAPAVKLRKPLNTGTVGCNKGDLHQFYTIYNKRALI